MPKDYAHIGGVKYPLKGELLKKVKSHVVPMPLVKIGDMLRLNNPGPGVNSPRLVVSHPTPGFLRAIDQSGRLCNYGLPHSPVWKGYTLLYNAFEVEFEEGC